MNDELIEHRLDTQDKRINSHSERLDKLEQQQAMFAVQIENLCSDLRQLTSVLKWLVGVIITTLLGFFIYAIQVGIFK